MTISNTHTTSQIQQSRHKTKTKTLFQKEKTHLNCKNNDQIGSFQSIFKLV
jgi:hypothetical protein